jgi:NAD(P)-dependent dehydrogenase (short-subunit alcohol dehydrogenase family)
MATRYAGRLVLITGAGGGLGRALALGFAREGARLILTDVDEPGMQETATLAGKEGAVSSTHRFDLGVEAEIK